MNNENLDIENFQNDLAKVIDIILQYRSNLKNEPVVPSVDYSELQNIINEPLPTKGSDITKLVQEVRSKIITHCSKVGHPKFLAWMNNSSSDAGILGEIINVGLNQVPLAFKGGPVVTVIEDLVVKWFGKLFGLPSGFGGSLVSGGTMANLTSLLTAREVKGENTMSKGLDLQNPLTIYISEQGHVSLERAVGIIGIGTNNIRKIAVNEDFKINTDALTDRIESDIKEGFKPFCIVAQGGSAHVGAVDPIYKLAGICKKYNLWLHVDAAYGGAGILSNKKELFKGIELADSITTDPHKWFYMPVESGLVLIKNEKHLFDTFTGTSCKAYKGDGIEKNYLDYGVQIARASKALKVWFALKYYGIQRIGECVKKNIELAIHLKDLLENNKNWEVLNPVDLSVVCFRFKPDSIKDETIIDTIQNKIIQRIETSGKGFVTSVNINNKTAVRVCIANHRTTETDISELFHILNQIAKDIMKTDYNKST